ncbi:hypothetical protein [Pontibacter cellulosilyticus]|uniref:Lipoprotein n=1 Tax=Pontibacter cellulosilyticus TaxID=1720253 RepID=A0A923N8A8_9BACT|nr:hypothetical protein [Pontibacter cellulosilyticus]MBC5993627.1 hypothetical protein [Pontibacter cellulosilyticus]
MEKFTLKSLCVFAFSFVLLSCENESEATSPFTVSDSKNFGTAPGTCEVIEFDGYNQIETGAGAITTVYSEGTPVRVSAQLRSNKGDYQNTNAAILYNTSQPDAKNKNFITPNKEAIRPMGHVLTAGKVHGKSTAIYNQGSRVEMDFAAMGSINLKAIHVLDITEDEADSKLELLDKNGRVIKTFKLPVTGAYGATRLNTGDTPGVAKIRVTFGGEGKRAGSGAIDVIEFCRS